MMNDLTFQYDGQRFPDYIRRGNACRHIATTALEFCKGIGVDVGAGKWPLPGAIPVELKDGGDAMNLPLRDLDFVFSSHALEHLVDPVSALEHWRDCLKPGGVLFLYLPHPAMSYWRPSSCRKHLHIWQPEQVVEMLEDLDFMSIMHGERDLAWSFACVGFKDEL